MKISVMIPAYKRVDFLDRCLCSVTTAMAAARGLIIEVCVVDNCTPGESIKSIVLNYAHYGVKYFRNELNLGMFGNWNRCIQLASGDWIHILHDDDEVDVNFYSELSRTAELNPNALIIWAGCEYINEKGRLNGRTFPYGPDKLRPDFLVKELAERNLFTPPVIVVKKDAYLVCGGFRPEFGFACDWDMWLRVVSLGQIASSSKMWARYRSSSSNATFNLIASASPARETYYFSLKTCQERLGMSRTEAEQVAQRAVVSVSFGHYFQLYYSLCLISVMLFSYKLIAVIGFRAMLVLALKTSPALPRGIVNKVRTDI